MVTMTKTIARICKDLSIDIIKSTAIGNTSRLLYRGIDIGYINPEVHSANAVYGYKFRFDESRDGFSKAERAKYRTLIASCIGKVPLDWFHYVKSKDRYYLLIGDAIQAERILKLEIERIDNERTETH